MAGIFRLHNKFHRSSHHTLSSTLTQDQGLDPIASQNEPFNGVFYNTLTDQENTFRINTNSYEWYSAYNTVSTLSAGWNTILSTYTTVNSNSANWYLGYSAYNTLNPLSANFESTYTTVSENSASWSDPNLLYTNRVQENTRSKTFSGYNLTAVLSSVEWNLDVAQVAYLTLYGNRTIQNPVAGTAKRGGIYTLYVIQGGSANYNLSFDTLYKFPIGTNVQTDLLKPLSGVTVFNFLCDGTLMLGDLYKVQL